MADGYRESSESWASLLRDCQRRGMRAPVLAVGDGALGFWNALNEVFPETRHQRCWVHKTANCLDRLPKSAQPAAKKAIQDIYNAEDKEHAAAAVKAFAKQYSAKFPKAVKKIVDDEDELLAFYDFGRVLLLDGLRSLREQGATTARLFTGTANPHRSYDLYESVGFRRRNEYVRYRKPLA